MKKIFMSIVLIGALMVTGCNLSKETQEKQEEITVVYCSDCGDKSNEVTKFCSSCGEEAKWVSQKPEIEKVNKDNEETEETDTQIKNTEEVKIEKDQCLNCGKYFNKNELKKFYEGLLCNTCYNLPKNCKNGFVGLCEGCEECESQTSTYNENFTYEDAIEIAENYYGIKNHADNFVAANMEPDWDDNGMYYVAYIKSKEMMEQGGSGILFTVRVYGNGTLVE